MKLDRICQADLCDEDIGHKHSVAKYCSDACRNSMRPDRQPRRVERYERRNGAGRCAESNCAQEVIGRKTGAKFCSVNCMKKDWRRRNPSKFLSHGMRRRTRIAANSFAVTDKDLRRTLHRFRNRCAYCGSGERLAWDHVTPIARGGAHSVGNLLPACTRCNSSKGSTFLYQWKHRDRFNTPPRGVEVAVTPPGDSLPLVDG